MSEKFLDFSIEPYQKIKFKSKEILSFIVEGNKENIDWETIDSFGEEWTKFSQFSDEEIQFMGDEYFDILPKHLLTNQTSVLDVGCGSGRWSKYLADKVGYIEAIDPSKAVFVASQLLEDKKNVRVSQASVDGIPFKDNAFDLVFSLGVLHHIPDTAGALKKCVEKIKNGGHFVVYLYYKLDGLPLHLKVLFKISDILRNIIHRLPTFLKKLICDAIALIIYVPLSFLAKAVEKIFPKTSWHRFFPLWYYRNKSLNVMRNDALDRFGTPLEQRYSKEEINKMMVDAGLKNIVFSDNAPYWHAIGQK